MIRQKGAPIVNVTFRSHTRAVLLALLVALGRIPYDRIQALAFMVGMSWEGRRSPLMGLTFIRDSKGPFSAEVDDVISGMIREGLCEVYEDDGHRLLKLTLAGRSVALQYTEVLSEINRQVHRTLEHMSFLEDRLSALLVRTRRGDVLIPLKVEDTVACGD